MYHHFNLFLLVSCYALILYGIIVKEYRYLTLPVGFIAIFVYPLLSELLINLKAKIFKSEGDRQSHLEKHCKMYKRLIPISYSDDYNITACGLEKLHPFDSCKYKGVFTGLTQNSEVRKNNIYQPSIPSREVLLEVMSPWYLLLLNYSPYICKCIEVPVCFMPAEILRYRLLNPMMKAVDGTTSGVCMALEHGWAINLSGGYHHASKSSGGGFCIYPDITFAVHHLRKWHSERVKKVMIVDLDAHQGNGHERDFIGDEFAMQAIKKEVLVNHRHSDEEYNNMVRTALKQSIETFRPDFLVYNAGTDCMAGDPLGNMNLSREGIIIRDQIVFSAALENGIPILMVLSGGYQKVNAPTISESILNLFDKFKLIENMHLNH